MADSEQHTLRQRTTLLDLPLELQQCIAELSDMAPTLRLTCKALEAAPMRTFGKTYLQGLQCFILEPARWRRIHNIVLEPGLAPHVRSIKFTSNPAEHREVLDIPLVPKWAAGNPEAVNYCMLAEISRAAADAPALARPCVSLMTQALDSIQRLPGRPIVELDLTADCFVQTATHRDILCAVATTGIPLTTLRMNLASLVGIGDLLSYSGAAVLKCCESLVELFVDLWTTPGTSHDVPEDLPVHWALVRSILREAKSLHTFRMCHRLWPSLSNEDQAHLAHVWLLEDAPAVQTLDIEDWKMDSSTLVAALERSRPQLKTLRLNRVVVESPDGNGWMEVFRTILTLPCPEKLTLVNLFKHRTGDRMHKGIASTMDGRCWSSQTGIRLAMRSALVNCGYSVESE